MSGRQHLLKNLVQRTAYDLKVGSDNGGRFDGPDDARDLRAGDSPELLTIGSMQTGTPELAARHQGNSTRR